MSAKPTLTYFNCRGYAEPIRYLLVFSGIEYEERRVQYVDNHNVKSCFPYQQGPVLEINGKTINQSNAITRYIAKLGGLTGSDDFEELQIHAFTDTINDFRDAIVDCYWGVSNEDQSKKEENLKKEILPFYLKRFEKALKNHNGYFVNGRLSYADVIFAGLIQNFSDCGQDDIINGYPHLTTLVEKINKIPPIRALIHKGPSNIN